MSNLKVVTENGITDAHLYCASCFFATSEGEPRWRNGQLCCGTPQRNSNNEITSFKCINDLQIVDASALTSCQNQCLDLSDLIVKFVQTESLTLVDLINWLGALKLSASLLDAHTSWDKEPYSWNRIIHTPTFDLIVCCWKKGQRTFLHSHDGNFAAIRAVSGRILSRIYQLDESHSKPTELKNEHLLETDSVSGVDKNEAHQLIALEQSVSIHIYNKPLGFITRFDSLMQEGNLQVVSF